MPASRRSLLAGLAATGGSLALARPARATPRADVLIIGAGISGLHAATQLADMGVDVRIIEANTRVGGRIWTRRDVYGRPEMGPHQVGSNYGRVRDNCRRFGVALVPPLAGNFGESVKFDYAISVDGAPVLQEPWAQSKANRLAPAEREIPPYELYKHYTRDNPLPGPDAANESRFAALNRKSMRDIVLERGASPEAVRLMECDVIAASLADQCALDEFKRFAIWALDSKNAAGLPGGSTYSVMRDGTASLPDAMAKPLRDRIHLGRTVVAIREERDGVRVVCEDGETWQAKYVLCSLPLGVLRRTKLDLPLDALQRRAIADLRYSSQIQVYLRLLKPYWDEDGLPRNTWTDGPLDTIMWQPSQVAPEGYIQITVNGWQANALRKVPPAELRDYVLRTLAHIRPSTQGRVEFLAAHDFETSRFTRGAYCYLRPGEYGAVGDALVRPAGRVHFCGEHISDLFAGMEGACETAERAVLKLGERLAG